MIVAAFYSFCCFMPGLREASADSWDTESDLSPGEDKRHIQLTERTQSGDGGKWALEERG